MSKLSHFILAFLVAMAIPFAGLANDQGTDADEIEIPAPRREAPVRKAAAPQQAPMAEEEPQFGPREGDWEVTLTGSGANDNHFDNGGFGVSGSLGYFLTDRVETVLRQSVTFADTRGGDSIVVGSTRVALDYHLPIGKRLFPYVGANIGGVYGDVNDTFAAAPELGVKWYALEKTFFFTQAEYQFFFRNSGGVDDGFENGQFLYSVGIGFNW